MYALFQRYIASRLPPVKRVITFRLTAWPEYFCIIPRDAAGQFHRVFARGTENRRDTAKLYDISHWQSRFATTL
jgi:hypothetical protein